MYEDRLMLNAGQKYGLLSTFIKLLVVIKTFVLSTFEWPFYTGFTVYTRDIFYVRRKLDLMKMAKVNAYIMHIFGKIKLLSIHAA